MPLIYRQFLLLHDGAILTNCSVDRPQDGNELEASIRELYGLKHGTRIQDNLRSAQQDIPTNYLVIGDDIGGNLILMEVDAPHTVYWWDHETGNAYTIAWGFDDLLRRMNSCATEP